MTPTKTKIPVVISNTQLDARSYREVGAFKKIRAWATPKRGAIYLELSSRPNSDLDYIDKLGDFTYGSDKGVAFDMSFDSAVLFANGILAAVKEGRGFIDRRQGEDRRKA